LKLCTVNKYVTIIVVVFMAGAVYADQIQPKQGVVKAKDSLTRQETRQAEQDQKEAARAIQDLVGQMRVEQQRETENRQAQQNRNDYENEIQRKLANYTLLLAGIGFLQFLVLAGTGYVMYLQRNLMGEHATHLHDLAGAARNNLSAINKQAEIMTRQADEMEQQRGVLQGQLSIMSGQLNVSQDAVTAVKKSADAAEKSAVVSVNAIRAWVDVRLQTAGWPFHYFSAINYGQTPAKILRHVVEFEFAKQPSFQGELFLPQVKSTHTQTRFLGQNDPWSFEVIRLDEIIKADVLEKINRGEVSFVLTLTIFYLDVTDTEQEHCSTFLYTFDVAAQHLIAIRDPTYRRYT